MPGKLGTAERPLRVAIIGAGPAGFYAAEALLKNAGVTATIDFFNHFPTPYGLVRDGVAPDHESIKAVTRVYDRILENPKVRYFGNVTLGEDVHLADIKPLYDMILYAVGSPSDRRMGIPGEDLAGSLPATAFVGWYNGHPEYADLAPDLSHERAIVVGIGNVAVDVARILLRSTDELAQTDIADYALDALRASNVREVVMLGRRGPVQAAFTNAELKELGEMVGVDVVVDPADVVLDPDSEAEMAKDRVAARNVEILRAMAAQTEHTQPRRLFLRFLVSPVEVIGKNGHVSAVKIEKNELYRDDWGTMRPRGLGQFETLDAGLVLRSVGYKGTPLKDVPFNTKTSTVSNAAGRVVDPVTGAAVEGEYVTGWAKRGPTGIIGTNKPDSVETVSKMIEDLATLPGIADENRDPARVEALLQSRHIAYVTYDDWKVLDRYEQAAGAAQGRPRVKVTSVPAMLQVIRENKEVPTQ
ncbi:MAG: FAD-dependent oxidoreductase [Anaerolineae bacterium]